MHKKTIHLGHRLCYKYTSSCKNFNTLHSLCYYRYHLNRITIEIMQFYLQQSLYHDGIQILTLTH